MSDTRVIAALDSATLAANHDATERWNRWVERGRTRDARTRRRMGIVASSVAVALAGKLGWVLIAS